MKNISKYLLIIPFVFAIQSCANKSVVSEGRVYKSLESNRTFKAINNKFLLKYEQ